MLCGCFEDIHILIILKQFILRHLQIIVRFRQSKRGQHCVDCMQPTQFCEKINENSLAFGH